MSYDDLIWLGLFKFKILIILLLIILAGISNSISSRCGLLQCDMPQWDQSLRLSHSASLPGFREMATVFAKWWWNYLQLLLSPRSKVRTIITFKHFWSVFSYVKQIWVFTDIMSSSQRVCYFHLYENQSDNVVLIHLLLLTWSHL